MRVPSDFSPARTKPYSEPHSIHCVQLDSRNKADAIRCILLRNKIHSKKSIELSLSSRTRVCNFRLSSHRHLAKILLYYLSPSE